MNKILERKFIEQNLYKLREINDKLHPASGWIKSIRSALGMNTRQLGDRLKATASGVRALEKKELSGAVTIHTLEKVAEAMECELVYAFVPRESLDAIVEKQARKVAGKRISRVSHTMALEKQELTKQMEQEMLEELVQELVHTMPRVLWE